VLKHFGRLLPGVKHPKKQNSALTPSERSANQEQDFGMVKKKNLIKEKKMIKNIQLRVSSDPRGKIKSGMKVNNIPKSLDYFNISKFPELIRAYGEKPSVLILFFPTNRISDFFDCSFILWNKTNTKTRSCDGETCFHRIAEEVGGIKYTAGQESPCVCKTSKLDSKDKKACRYTAYFKAYIATPQSGKVESPMCYLFETGSHNTGENILSELEKILVLNDGKLIGVPFALSVKMVAGRDANTKFPIWAITPIGLLTEIRKRSQSFELSPTDLVPGLALPQVTQTRQDIQTDNYSCFVEEIKIANSQKKLKSIHEDVQASLKGGNISQDQYEAIRISLNTKWLKVK
jgi:hypothetical protein